MLLQINILNTVFKKFKKYVYSYADKLRLTVYFLQRSSRQHLWLVEEVIKKRKVPLESRWIPLKWNVDQAGLISCTQMKKNLWDGIKLPTELEIEKKALKNIDYFSENECWAFHKHINT